MSTRKTKQNNAHIVEEAWSLPTTQKAVVNAVVQAKINCYPHGSRELYMDNRYSSPELFVLLREQHQIRCCGTIRSNRKGWDSKIMNLAKSSARGSKKYHLFNWKSSIDETLANQAIFISK